ncbi:3-dehydroquinate dehydratase [Stackebrandtia albiflava]|uniref:3-dehydroquinate dehydratase n=1 Tax=Stackebrandtia albiflava TaxID=406432 RepID=A0A562VD03_9ACTN|nr:type II 3-dehydroquinate dehydratase [Stackebrandtia albiflava]TWJ15742.1 3-dehydroquinate dehydratase [Stackebrandtia albiflava]
MNVTVLNGPNLNRLGTREPHIYGAATYRDLETLVADTAARLGLTVEMRQTNAESELLGWLHDAADTGTDVVLNAAAWTHTSVAVGDACAMLTGRLIEVHISNVHRREPFRHHSYVSAHADGVIVGCGPDGYRLALEHLAATAPG